LPTVDRRQTGTCGLASRGPQVASLEQVENRMRKVVTIAALVTIILVTLIQFAPTFLL
jgi:hypothetical protein